MNKTHELSDAQLDAISGGCYRPEPKKCDYDYEPKKFDKHDDYDYDCYQPKKQHCESPWERWYERCHDYFERS